MQRVQSMLVLSCCMLLIAGCTLRQDSETSGSSPSMTPIAATPAPVGAVITVTPLPVAGVALSTSSAPVTAPTGCAVRTDWPLHTVVAGDTLATIASRTSSTIAELVTANCLVNANLIAVSQMLRVPRMLNPTVNVAVSTHAAYRDEGQIAVSPSIDNNGAEILQPGVRVQLTWPITQTTISAYAEFYFTPSGDMPRLIGTDLQLGDGVSTFWDVPANVYGVLTAALRTSTGTVLFSTLSGNDVSSFAGPKADMLTLTAVIAATYQYQDYGVITVNPGVDTNGAILIEALTRVRLIWQSQQMSNIPGAYAEFYVIRTGDMPEVIGTDMYLEDGVSVNWEVPATLTGTLTAAIRTSEENVLFRTAVATNIVSREKNIPSLPGSGRVTLSPATGTTLSEYNIYCEVVIANSLVTLSWEEGSVTPINQVEFYFWPFGNSSSIRVGVDNNLADGASFVWMVPGGSKGKLSAVAKDVNDYTIITTDPAPLLASCIWAEAE